MFSRGNIADINPHVTEKRAPTDESVRLLREMEKEVLKNIDLSNNQFSARGSVFEDQLKTIINDWFVREENMEVESITFDRSQPGRPWDASHTTVTVSLRKRKDNVDVYQR